MKALDFPPRFGHMDGREMDLESDMLRSGILRRYGLWLTAILAMAPAAGCGRLTQGPGPFLQDRLKDLLDIPGLGLTFTATPQLSLYGDFASIAPMGFGQVDGYALAIGEGDMGWMRYYSQSGGLLLYGREEVGFGDGLFFRFGDFDKDDKSTLSCMGVGLFGLLAPPYDRRPCAAPA